MPHPARLQPLLSKWRLRPSARAFHAGRNDALLCEGRHGRVLVKQAEPGRTLAVEAAALERWAHARAFRVPRCLFRTRDARVLGVEWVERAPTLFALHHRCVYPAGLAESLGRALAELHARPSRAAPARLDFAAQLRWPTPDLFARLGPAGVELVARVQAAREAHPALGWLSRRAHLPRLSRPVHGDLRQPNVLVPARGPPVLLDWEQSGAGDPAADVGSLLGDYLLEYLVPTGAGLGLPRLRRFGRALLSAYAADRPHHDEHFFLAAVCWAAASLLRNAFAMARDRGELGVAGDHLVAAGLKILAAPGRFLPHLFGARG